MSQQYDATHVVTNKRDKECFVAVTLLAIAALKWENSTCYV